MIKVHHQLDTNVPNREVEVEVIIVLPSLKKVCCVNNYAHLFHCFIYGGHRRHKHRRSRSRSRGRNNSRDRHHHHRHRHSRSRTRSRSPRRSRDTRHRSSHTDKNDRQSSGYGPQSHHQLEKQRKLNEAALIHSSPSTAANTNSGAPSQRRFDPKLSVAERAAIIQKEVEQTTGIQMPKYYNPSALNPVKYAEQMQKRKLLWSKAKEGKTENETLWKSTASALDNSSSNKFQKLMGLKSSSDDATPKQADTAESSKQKQDQLFTELDREYEFARMSTHTHRGMGLGFQSASVDKFAAVMNQKK